MKTIEQKKPLLQRTLFGVKRATLEAKITSYFKFSQDVATFIKYLVVVMVRNSLVVSDFSFLCQELVCEVFLTAEPSDVLREYCAYFKDYFKKSGDWDKVVHRLFNDKKEYYRLTEEARSNKKLLDTPGTEKAQNSSLTLRIISAFEDASGKKHTLTIADADETRSRAETSELLEILTTVALFETAAGVRRFVKFIQAKRPGTKETFKETVVEVDQVEQPADQQEECVLNSEVEPADDELEIQKSFLEPVIESQSSQTLLKDRVTPKTIDDVSAPPTTKPQKTKKKRLLTHKEAYVQSLIENWSQKNHNGKNKESSIKKKRR